MNEPAPKLWVTMTAVGADGLNFNFSTDGHGPDAVRAKLFRTTVHTIVTAGVETWTTYLVNLPPTECSCPDDHLVLVLWPEWGAIPTAADRTAFAHRTYRTLAYLLESPTALDCAANFHPRSTTQENRSR
jgi:hypothetical protein